MCIEMWSKSCICEERRGKGVKERENERERGKREGGKGRREREISRESWATLRRNQTPLQLKKKKKKTEKGGRK